MSIDNVENSIKTSLKERYDNLVAKAKKAEQRWTAAREKYYKSLLAIPLNKWHKDYNKLKKKSEDNFFEMTLAGDAYVDATKRANDNYITTVSYLT